MAITPKLIAQIACGLAFVGWVIQLGGLDSLNHKACKDSKTGSPATFATFAGNILTATPAAAADAAAAASRKLLGTPSDSTLSARCAMGFAFNW